VVRKKRRVQGLSGKPQGASFGRSTQRECGTHETLPAGQRYSAGLANPIQVGVRAVTRRAQLDSFSSRLWRGRRSWPSIPNAHGPTGGAIQLLDRHPGPGTLMGQRPGRPRCRAAGTA
jgi:hypothetical protein